ncbi:hypothetical protein Pmani_011903 [Petrolisthes manimaculis]|uniref:Uncharacterized protein n=1 Tax=Petrolisthes manimaculis TaxID=1843537 RepID=A0AAE1Q1L8_9EUCA|nr:hypothetical protein Pmani_011903 [Petrolisthes manimaculis]
MNERGCQAVYIRRIQCGTSTTLTTALIYSTSTFHSLQNFISYRKLRMWNKFASSQLAIVVVFCLALGVVGQQDIDSLNHGDFCFGKDNAVKDIDETEVCCRCVNGIVDCVSMPECPAPPTSIRRCCTKVFCGCTLYYCSVYLFWFGGGQRCWRNFG